MSGLSQDEYRIKALKANISEQLKEIRRLESLLEMEKDDYETLSVANEILKASRDEAEACADELRQRITVYEKHEKTLIEILLLAKG